MTINYQWQLSKDAGESYTNIGYSGTVLHLTGIRPEDHGNIYRCRLNRGSSKKYRYTEPAILTVLPEVSIENLPTTVSISGGNLSLNPSITLDNNATNLLQWQYSDNGGQNFYDLISQTGSSLSLSNLTYDDNNSQYRLKIESYYFSGIKTTKLSDTVQAKIENDLPELIIWRNPQNYYGTGIAKFDIATAPTGLYHNSIPNFYDADTPLYSWERSKDGGTTWTVLGDNNPTLAVDNRSNDANGYLYRTNVSIGNHSVISEPASIFSSFKLQEQKAISKIFGLSHLQISAINDKILGIFSNNPRIFDNEASKNITLLTISDNKDTYDLVLNLHRTTRYGTQPYSTLIRDISLYKNNNLIRTATVNFDKQTAEKSELNITTTAGSNQTINSRCATVGLAGMAYDKGYCINFMTTLHPNMLNNLNYLNMVKNSIVKSSRKKFGMLKVGFITTGNTATDDSFIAKINNQTVIINNLANSTISCSKIDIIDRDTLNTFDVVILNNSHNWARRRFSNDEQTNIKNYVKNGGGLITGEWVIWNAATGKFSILSDVFAVIPTTRYRGRTTLRYYNYDTDNIINHNVQNDFEFSAISVAGVDTSVTSVKPDADIFYISELCIPLSTNTLKTTSFNVLDVFELSATETLTNQAYGLNKHFECSFNWAETINKNLKLGGLLYWVYKSLIEHYRKADPGSTKPQSPWNLGSSLLGPNVDGTSIILEPFNKSISDFIYTTTLRSDIENVDINSDFWKDLSRLLNGLRPNNPNHRTQKEISLNQIAITQQPKQIAAVSSGIATISSLVVSSNHTPITYTLQKEQAINSNVFSDVETVIGFKNQNIDINVLGEPTQQDTVLTKYRLLFETDNAYKYSDIFSISTSPTLSSPITEYSFQPVAINDSGIFTHDTETLVNWQYSYDNKNFYNTTDNVSITGDHSQLTLASGDYQKYIRYSMYYQTEESVASGIVYSAATNYDDKSVIGLTQIITHTYQQSGVYYASINLSFESAATQHENLFNANDVIWQQYNSLNNTYENIPNTSGNFLLQASGIPIVNINQYKFRAKINNRIFYPL